jgi:hypothetical protein
MDNLSKAQVEALTHSWLDMKASLKFFIEIYGLLDRCEIIELTEALEKSIAELEAAYPFLLEEPHPDREPKKVKTEDGYVFTRQENGSYSDGDMTFKELEELKSKVNLEELHPDEGVSVTKRIANLTDVQNWIEEFICSDWNNLFPRVNRIFAEHVTIAGPIASIQSSVELTALLEQEGGEVAEDIWNDIVAMGITDRPTVVYEGEGVYIVDKKAKSDDVPGEGCKRITIKNDAGEILAVIHGTVERVRETNGVTVKVD